MSWISYFDRIYVINLKKRTDRWLQIRRTLTEYKIPYKRVEAIFNEEKPCVGLVHTMQKIFSKSLDLGHQRVMILEDDATPLLPKKEFHQVMNACVKQLPPDWDLFYIGYNATGGFQTGHYSPNLLPSNLVYSTHAACYSRQAMRFIASRTIEEPVDNYMVKEYQPDHKILCSYPMLMTQVSGYSDIGKGPCDWAAEIKTIYEESLKQMPK